ncbi:LCP family protein [Rhizohabitans arisaemae]|uniref:LCP family protein n=1 Tax=Rhizohabitans arisaemae TaxID=2720610 RepID=UPI0024B0B126|nr:LCP family protein [Rhizohabitans arisaemae]
MTSEVEPQVGDENPKPRAVRSDDEDRLPLPESGKHAEKHSKPRRRRLRRVLMVIGLVLAVLVSGTFALLLERQSTFNNNIRRIAQALPPEGDRPDRVVGAAQNWLLVGSDKRSDNPGIGQRADTIMLIHLAADRQRAYLVSFPRDAWVTVPGKGKAKINASYAWGGPSLLIATIEKLSGVRIDHFASIDFEGFADMTDALGGVEVVVPADSVDPISKITWKRGRTFLDGKRALSYVRQRHGLPGGDFDRIKRQQDFLRAVVREAASAGTLTNPFKLNAFLDAFTRAVSVDDSVTVGTLRELAFEVRDLRASDIFYATAPVRGTGTEQRQSVVYMDPKRSKLLFDALRTDRVDDYLSNAGEG